MCLADLYDFTPEQRTAVARLESLRTMRQYVQEVRSAIRADLFMSAAAADLPPSPPPGHAAAGNYLEQPA
jgi:hypothetical protein